MCKGTACVAERRHVIEAVVTVNVTEHQLLELPICMLYGDNRKGSFPADIIATVQYGENLQVLSVALNTFGAVSVKRTHEILAGVFNIPIVTGTRVDKKLWWVHDASNCEFTYLNISPKRGYLGMDNLVSFRCFVVLLCMTVGHSTEVTPIYGTQSTVLI